MSTTFVVPDAVWNDTVSRAAVLAALAAQNPQENSTIQQALDLSRVTAKLGFNVTGISAIPTVSGPSVADPVSLTELLAHNVDLSTKLNMVISVSGASNSTGINAALAIQEFGWPLTANGADKLYAQVNPGAPQGSIYGQLMNVGEIAGAVNSIIAAM